MCTLCNIMHYTHMHRRRLCNSHHHTTRSSGRYADENTFETVWQTNRTTLLLLWIALRVLFKNTHQVVEICNHSRGFLEHSQYSSQCLLCAYECFCMLPFFFASVIQFHITHRNGEWTIAKPNWSMLLPHQSSTYETTLKTYIRWIWRRT